MSRRTKKQVTYYEGSDDILSLTDDFNSDFCQSDSNEDFKDSSLKEASIKLGNSKDVQNEISLTSDESESEEELKVIKSANKVQKYKRSRLSNSIFPEGCDLSAFPLKMDHNLRPLWVAPNTNNDGALLILEAFSTLASRAQDFLTAIAEPVSRPRLFHEYKITPYSLYAAVSVGLSTNEIIKIEIPDSFLNFIRKCTSSYAKVKLVLKRNAYHLESSDIATLNLLLEDSVIASAKATKDQEYILEKGPTTKGFLVAGTKNKKELKDKEISASNMTTGTLKSISDDLLNLINEDDGVIEDYDVHSCQILTSQVEHVKKRCSELEFPVLEEYDFRNDTTNPDLKLDLKAFVKIRPYQERSLARMFGNGRARSGLIVLPCGAGKTLVGITASCTVKKRTLVLCTSAVSVAQWKQQFLSWTTIDPDQVTTFTSGQKENFRTNTSIIVTTYSMVANLRHRSYSSKKMLDYLQSREWGLLVLDEVHVVPANLFRQVVNKVPAHTKLGLTATLVREDNKIDDLNFLIGPKLYEASWSDLAQQGHLATVECAEVWCPMTAAFYREYLKEPVSRKRALLYAMNPTKFQACQYLIQLHEGRGDKIIVFSDNVFALKAYALKLQRPFIYGATSQQERLRLLQQFRLNPLLNTLFLSKVGDTSIDLPDASCLIQISSHFGSRRQEAQRLGRILRSKRRTATDSNRLNQAHFYTLVSRDTEEMYYSSKRQQFLVDQGYAFKVITQIEGLDQMDQPVYPNLTDQLELLQTVLMASEKDAEPELTDDEFDFGDIDSYQIDDEDEAEPNDVKVQLSTMKSLSGADTMAYIEYNRPAAHSFRHRGKNPFEANKSKHTKER